MSKPDEIKASRAIIENRLFQELQSILETQNANLDTNESAFSTFIIRALAQEISNSILYGSVVYRESSLITALLPETIKNWAKYIDYQPRKSIPATSTVLVQIPLIGEFKTQFVNNFYFYAGDIQFRNKYLTQIEYLSSNIVVTYVDNDNLVKTLPYGITYDNGTPILNIELEVIQISLETAQFQISNLLLHEFYQHQFSIAEDTQSIASVKVTDSLGTEYTVVDNIFTASSDEYIVQLESHKNNGTLIFGNGIYGKQPNQNVTITCEVTLTKGSLGNVLANTIVTGDMLYTTNSNPPLVVSYNVTNLNDIANGKDEEDLNSVRRNAPISLSALHRLVSHNDFVNTDVILNRNEIIKSIPVLKRSDLVANEIDLYSVFTFKNQIVPADTITIPVPENSLKINQFTPITYNSNEYILLFGIDIDLPKRIARYSYIPNEIVIDLHLSYSSGVPIRTTGISAKFNPSSLTFTLYTTVISDTTVDQSIIFYTSNTTHTFSPNTKNTIGSITTYTYSIPADVLLSSNSVELRNFITSQLVQIYTTKLDVTYVYNELTFSYISKDNKYIRDVPVVLKSYYDSLSSNDKIQLQTLVISDFIYKTNTKNVRLMNSNVASKFTRTYGKLQNLQYSKATYHVKKIIHSQSELQPDQSYYAISDPVDDSEFSKYVGYISIWDGIQYQYFKPGIGTIIRNYEDDQIYASDGARWIIPNYSLPLDIEIEIHTDRTDGSIVSEVTQAILIYVNSLQIEESLYLSKIIDVVQSVSGIKYCRLISPKTDIIYRDIVKNIPDDKFDTYTPEYIYTNEQHVRVFLTI